MQKKFKETSTHSLQSTYRKLTSTGRQCRHRDVPIAGVNKNPIRRAVELARTPARRANEIARRRQGSLIPACRRLNTLGKPFRTGAAASTPGPPASLLRIDPKSRRNYSGVSSMQIAKSRHTLRINFELAAGGELPRLNRIYEIGGSERAEGEFCSVAWRPGDRGASRWEIVKWRLDLLHSSFWYSISSIFASRVRGEGSARFDLFN